MIVSSLFNRMSGQPDSYDKKSVYNRDDGANEDSSVLTSSSDLNIDSEGPLAQAVTLSFERPKVLTVKLL